MILNRVPTALKNQPLETEEQKENEVAIASLAQVQTSLAKPDAAISRRLVDARLSAEPLPSFPGRLPETLEQAYAIQSASADRWPDEVAAWKVARLTPPDRARFQTEGLAGPVFKSSIQTVEPGSCEVMAIYEGGFAAIEAEYALELGAAVPPSDKDYSDEELADLVRAVYGAAEIAGSPMALVNELGAMSVISDFGANAGLVVGPNISGWRSLARGSLSASVAVDDVTVGEAAPDGIGRGPLQALRFLIGLCASRGIELPEGALISTGALTGVHDVRMNSTARVEFGSFGSFEVKFEPVAPKR